MRFACLVVPKELLDLVRLQHGDFGWLTGTRSQKDNLYLMSRLKQSNQDIWGQLPSLLRHARFFGPSDDVPWFKVQAGFRRALEQGSITTPTELRTLLPSSANMDSLKGVRMALFMEPDGTTCCALVFYNESGPFSMYQGDLSILESYPDFGSRLDGVAPLGELGKKSVLIVGVGSGGGNIAVQLAAAGVGSITLFDPDRLEPVNVFRHVCGLEYVGCYKVHGIQELIVSYGLKTRVTAHHDDILTNTTKFFEAVHSADLVVCASDTKESRALVNFAAVSLHKPMVAAGAYDGATIGEIAVYQDGLPCLECARITLRNVGALETDYSETSIPDRGDYRSTGATQPHSRGTRVDITLIASLATKVCLLALTTETNLMTHLPASYLVWGSAKNNSRAAPFHFDWPMSLHYVPILKLETCPVCGDHLRKLEKKHARRLSNILKH